MEQLTLAGAVSILSIGRCRTETDQYEYTKEIVQALLADYFEGVGDVEQRMDLVNGLKKLSKGQSTYLVGTALGLDVKEIARLLMVHHTTIYRWRRGALDKLVAVMNGGA